MQNAIFVTVVELLFDKRCEKEKEREREQRKSGVAYVNNLFWVVLLTSFMYSLHLKWHLSAIVDNSINKLILMVGQI